MKLLFIALIATVVCTAAKLPTRDSSLATRQLPSTFTWSSSGALVSPPSGSGYDAFKDPSIVNIDGTYHVFASTATDTGYNLVYFSFTNFDDAQDSTFHYLQNTNIGTGYRAAPQVFYFEPQNLWYLVFQNGNAAYSTNTNIANPNGWTAPVNFFTAEPSIINQNIGSGYWVDMWVICDTSNCYLFSSDDNGHLYRSSTTLSNFPNGFGNTVIALQDTSNKYHIYEGSAVYNVGSGKYLLIVEGIGSDGYRYYNSWTSTSLSGSWAVLADTEAVPFASHYNVNFVDGAWTESISHGEIVRTNTDQTLTISPCNLKFLYQGLSPTATGDYNALPWKLGLLTQTNSAC